MPQNKLEKKVAQIEAESFEPEKVVEDLLRMKAEREKGNEPENGSLLIIGGGGQRGVFGGGGAVALTKLFLVQAFKRVVGVSTGAPTASYLLSDQASVGNSVYVNENTDGNVFLDSRRSLGQPIMDIDWLCDFFKNGNKDGEKKLDVAKMLANPTELFYAVTNVENGTGELLNAKQLKDPIGEGIKASCAVPGLYGKEVDVVAGSGASKKYIDGGVALPMPIKESFSIQTPTSVIIFANRPQNFKDSFFDNDKIFDEQIKFLKDSKVPYIIFWTDNTLKPIDKRKTRLQAAADNFEQYVFDFINKTRLESKV